MSQFKIPKQQRQTSLVELAEIHNLFLSLNRLRQKDSETWKRALYHALQMSYIRRDILEKIRLAMDLP